MTPPTDGSPFIFLCGGRWCCVNATATSRSHDFCAVGFALQPTELQRLQGCTSLAKRSPCTSDNEPLVVFAETRSIWHQGFCASSQEYALINQCHHCWLIGYWMYDATTILVYCWFFDASIGSLVTVSMIYKNIYQAFRCLVGWFFMIPRHVLPIIYQWMLPTRVEISWWETFNSGGRVAASGLELGTCLWSWSLSVAASSQAGHS